MVEIPTREEIYAQFRAVLPEAPARLSRTRPEHEWYRQQWLDTRDEILNEWTNRIYWERYPDGPLKIDPESRPQPLCERVDRDQRCDHEQHRS